MYVHIYMTYQAPETIKLLCFAVASAETGAENLVIIPSLSRSGYVSICTVLLSFPTKILPSFKQKWFLCNSAKVVILFIPQKRFSLLDADIFICS